MAKITAVWGIDVGESALKALRCVPGDDASRISAVAFDYIEYPKLLSQADLNERNDLVREALKQFLSRNQVRGDKVVISVSGQSGLARFIKLPPVETKKIPDIVKYEAKQQIPFALEEVVWDYQQLSGGSTEEGFALDSEVGLFAIKRDQAYRFLKPFDEVDEEVDIIQLTPMALYNWVCFDQLTNLPPADEYDPDNPPPSVVVMSLGTDTTDLVVTNGFRVWQRSIPVGGNHFTKALVKDLKLNFGTAEHLKRNASQAEDPKALFQAMKPVFSDLLTEVQRSLNFFKNVDRKAKIGRVVVLGNAIKLPGLQKYLAQNLGFDLTRIDAFRGLSGSGVVDQPAFKENLPAYGVCYGLALQGLQRAKMQTNLLPHEIRTFRLIRAKKPWAALAAAMLLLAFGVSFFRWSQALDSVSKSDSPGDPTRTFKQPLAQANALISETAAVEAEFTKERDAFFKTDEVGRSVLQNMQNRDLWLKVLKAVNLCLPRNEGELPKEIAQRLDIKIDDFECRWVTKLEDWYAKTHGVPVAAAAPGVPGAEGDPNAGALPPPEAPVDPNAPPADDAPPAAPPGGPTGPGWVVQISAHHYRNLRNKPDDQGIQYLRRTVLANLEKDEVPLPAGETYAGGRTFPVKALGILHPVLIEVGPIDWNYKLTLADDDGPQPGAPQEAASGTKVLDQPRFDFKIQFCWQPFKPAESATPAAPADAMAAQ